MTAATEKPFAPACERNRAPILSVLRKHFANRRHVLEIGSGTGQHAVHFAAAMPWLTWQCSDVADHLPGIRLWLDEAGLPNTPPPLEFDVARGLSDDVSGFDAVFSANTLHIMGWAEVEAFFAGVGKLLADAEARTGAPASGQRPPSPAGTEERAGDDGVLVVYGPFNYGGDYTSASNREFDGWLKARDPRSGIRDFEAVDALARGIGLQLVDDIAMPANNRCLVWQKQRDPHP